MSLNAWKTLPRDARSALSDALEQPDPWEGREEWIGWDPARVQWKRRNLESQIETCKSIWQEYGDETAHQRLRTAEYALRSLVKTHRNVLEDLMAAFGILPDYKPTADQPRSSTTSAPSTQRDLSTKQIPRATSPGTASSSGTKSTETGGRTRLGDSTAGQT